MLLCGQGGPARIAALLSSEKIGFCEYHNAIDQAFSGFTFDREWPNVARGLKLHEKF